MYYRSFLTDSESTYIEYLLIYSKNIVKTTKNVHIYNIGHIVGQNKKKKTIEKTKNDLTI